MDDIEATIIRNKHIAAGYYLLKLRLRKTMGKILPGQFVMLKIPGNEVFLRRPFSIYKYGKNTLCIMYRVVGKGTDILSKAKRNEKTLVLGPLGNGFQIGKKDKFLVVAGGIGFAGVRLLIDKLDKKASVFFGCSTKEELPLINDLTGLDVHVATLDGSYGFKGNVVELLENYYRAPKSGTAQVYVCGPQGMIKSLKEMLKKTRIPCQVLVEERMACGLGLCFGCAVKTTDEKEPYKRVCKEGPVFDLWEISL